MTWFDLPCLLLICSSIGSLLPGNMGQLVDVKGSVPGPFETTIRFPWPGTSPNQTCRAIGWTLLSSPSGTYTLEHVMICPKQTISCWAGVRRRFPEENATHGPRSANPLRDLVWRVPVELLQPSNSCALRFTTDGDFQFAIPAPVNPDTLLPERNDPGTILWSTNTSGLGVVDIELQDSGNLILTDFDQAIVWGSFGSTVSNSSSPSRGYPTIAMYTAVILISVCVHVDIDM